jgi:hypothetical protein
VLARTNIAQRHPERRPIDKRHTRRRCFERWASQTADTINAQNEHPLTLQLCRFVMLIRSGGIISAEKRRLNQNHANAARLQHNIHYFGKVD